jgi:microcystin-dependent protein
MLSGFLKPYEYIRFAAIGKFIKWPKLPSGAPSNGRHPTPKDYVDAEIAALQLEVTGAIKMFAGAAAPTGYLLCYGQAVSRTTYANLFTAISTTYGSGDGSTTFNVPDMRGLTVIGKDDMGGSAANNVTSASTNGANSTALGGKGGAETCSLTSGQNGAHTHTLSGNTNDTGSTLTAKGTNNAGTAFDHTTSSSGSGTAHNNMPPWIALNYIIKT